MKVGIKIRERLGKWLRKLGKSKLVQIGKDEAMSFLLLRKLSHEDKEFIRKVISRRWMNKTKRFFEKFKGDKIYVVFRDKGVYIRDWDLEEVEVPDGAIKNKLLEIKKAYDVWGKELKGITLDRTGMTFDSSGFITLWSFFNSVRTVRDFERVCDYVFNQLERGIEVVSLLEKVMEVQESLKVQDLISKEYKDEVLDIKFEEGV